MAVVIAECCQNHRGDLAVLRDMIWSAAEAGADYAKIQSIRAGELTYRARFESGEPGAHGRRAMVRPYLPEYDRLKPMDLDDDAHRWFVEECARAGIRPLTTVFTRGRVPFLASLPWNAVKVASYDCASYPLLEDLKGQFAHLFVSTGATEDDEIESAARLLAEVSFTFLHCVTIYPTPLDKLHLARLEWLRRWAPSVGFSDHTLVARDGLKAAVAALYLGADVIERHYTVLPRERVRDGPVSVDPAELRALVEFARRPRGELHDYVRREIPELEAMLGTVHRNLSEDELLNRDYYRGRFASRIGDEVIYNWQDYTFQRTEPGS